MFVKFCIIYVCCSCLKLMETEIYSQGLRYPIFLFRFFFCFDFGVMKLFECAVKEVLETPELSGFISSYIIQICISRFNYCQSLSSSLCGA